MKDNQILLQGITLEELAKSIGNDVKNEINALVSKMLSKNADDELLTRTEACELLKIDISTLWHWTNKGKVKAYGIASRRYYKRSEIIECLTPLSK